MQHIFLLCMVCVIAIGFHCARNLTSDNPFWVRMVTLSPCLAAFIIVIAIIQGVYVAFAPDILFSVTIILIYALVGSVVAGKSWLRIHIKPEQVKKPSRLY